MDANSQRQDNTLSLLGVAIDAMDLAKEVSSVTPAKAVFGSVSIILTMIRDSMANKAEYVELGLACADVCEALNRGMDGKKLDDLSPSVRKAMNQLTTTVEEIQKNVTKQSKRNAVSRFVRAKNDKETIAGWKSDLNRILHIFNTELAVNTHVTVSDIRRDVSKIREEIGGQVRSAPNSPIGETPPPPPRACFGRDKLIEKIINLSESLTPIALIGAGGIGKTSIALTVLHHDLIKGRFGDNRRFIRCDQFPASITHFLSRLSKVIGAGVENPEDLAPLRPFLSSRMMILFLDNAESILDPRGTNAREIYAVVEELSRCSNICLCITSRISTIPPDCKRLDIPTLSMVAAHDTFYRIYDSDQPSGVVDSILGQLDFHPLSITLLATVAHHNKWNTDRLSKEWDRRRTDVLHTRHDASLATTIELSLASPMFQELDPNARELLGVVAFFPQGIDEKNLEWLFPAIPDRTEVFDGFCVLSLTYKSNGFFVMLAPLREYLYPKDPGSSPLLHATKDHYFTRLSVYVDPAEPGFEEAGWITSEDVNVEHLLDVFTSVDANSADVWDTCASFMRHLNWHKPRLVTLEPRARALPDDHPSKPDCLFQLSQLFTLVGNNGESKQLLTHTLKLRREREDDFQVAEMLRFLSSTNKVLCLYEEGIEQAKEALEIYRRHNRIREQGYSLFELAWSLYGDNQIDAAEEATSQAIDLLADDEDAKFTVCGCYRLLGKISYSKGEVEKAIKHFETALGIASSSNWHSQLFWGNYNLAELFFDENRSADAHVHIERAKSHAINDPYNLGRAMKLQARIWYRDHRFEEGKSEAMRAADVYEGIGATKDVEDCRAILRDIEEAINEPAVSHESDSNVCGAE